MKKDHLLGKYFHQTILVLVLISALAARAHADGKDTIQWVINDAQPFYIFEGEMKGQGFGDRIQSMIINHMEDYNHIVLTRPLKRLILEMKTEQPRCFSTWIYNTRKDISVTSTPYLFYQPHGAVLLKQTSEKLGNPRTLSFKDLLLQTDYIFGKPLGRGYGRQLDPVLKNNGQTINIFQGAGKSTEGIFRMLRAGRIDYTVEYPSTMNYYAEKLDMKESLVFIPFTENQDSILLAAVACSNTQWGETIIKDINKVIIKIRELPEYKRIIQDWFIIKGLEDEYWEIYEREVLTRLK